MDARSLFRDALLPIYDALSVRVNALDSGVIEEFKKTQVSYGLARKFIWLPPLSNRTALLTIDTWHEHHDTMLRDVIRYRIDKFTHQVVVRTASDIDEVDRRGWLAQAAAWGRRERPGDEA
ncbi:DUF5655 domain-containing protein [Microbacterium aurum]